MEYETPNNLYHYCSLSTFCNIIKNKSIWATDIERSNDFLELVALRQLFTKTINFDLNRKTEYFISTGNQHEAAKVRTMQQVFNDQIRTAFTKNFVFCLSEEKDLLSQWRGYADDAQGIAIGFRKDFFDRFNSLNALNQSKLPVGFVFDKITYDENTAKQYILEQIEHFKLDSCQDVDNYRDILKNVMAKVSSDAPFYKIDAFKEENEWRLVITYFLSGLPNQDFEVFKNEYFTLNKINYYSASNQLRAYIEISIPQLTSAISEIIIGPKCKESIVNIKHFLICMGILKDINDTSIKITKSRASYR